MRKLLFTLAFLTMPGSAFATQAFICAENPTEEMDHPDALVSMIGEDTEDAEISAEVKLFLKGEKFEGEVKARSTKRGFKVKLVDSKGCAMEYEFSKYKLPPPDLLCDDCGRREDAPMVRVWQKCPRSRLHVAYELPCLHYED